MSKFPKFIRGTIRQLVILTGLAGLTFAAGINWAEAAETGAKAAAAVPSELHVIFLFLLTLGVLGLMVIKPQERARMRGRPEKRRTTRR
jgi:hypothetical protein